MIILEILLYFILIVLGLILLILLVFIFTPLYITLRHTTERYGNLFTVNLSWYDLFLGFGLFCIDGDWFWKLFFREKALWDYEERMGEIGKREKEKAIKMWDIDEEEREREKEAARRAIRATAPSPMELKEIGWRPAIGKVMVFLKRVYHSFVLKRLKWKCDFGFENPADTGMVYGWAQAIKAVLPNHRVRLNFRPDFLNPGFESDAQFSTKVYLFKILWAFIPFLWSEIRLLRRRKKRKKEMIKKGEAELEASEKPEKEVELAGT
jgi:hypothetical protein